MAEKPFTVDMLYDYVGESFHVARQDIPPSIRKKISQLLLDGYTPKEIARCICYYEEVRKGTLDLVYGIWFVPNVRAAAAAYFKQLELDQQNQATEAKKVVEYQDNNIIFNIKSLHHKKRKPKQLDVTDIDIEGDK